MDGIKERMCQIIDPRHQGYVKHKLEDILVIIMCAALSGIDNLGDLVIYAENKRDFFSSELDISEIPSKSTFSRILSMVDGKEVGNAIIDILSERFGSEGEVIAVDGKAIRSTSKAKEPHSALQILSAYVTSNGVILGQEAIKKKTNEIPVFQEMLSYLDVKGKTITADAMHCQRKTCEKIIQRKGEYLFGLKENQGSLLADVQLFFEHTDETEVETFQTLEKNSSRIEKRTCYKIKDISWLKEHEWPGLRTIFSIKREVDTRGQHTSETSYYISSRDTSAEHLMRLAREHWKIESMHWMLDVSFSEDNCRFFSENAHKTMNAFRKFALAVHKNFLAAHHAKSSIKASMLSTLLNSTRLIEILHFL